MSRAVISVIDESMKVASTLPSRWEPSLVWDPTFWGLYLSVYIDQQQLLGEQDLNLSFPLSYIGNVPDFT